MFQGEHSAILLTFIKLPFVIKIFVLSIFEWPFYTGFTVQMSEVLVLYGIFSMDFTKPKYRVNIIKLGPVRLRKELF